MSSADREILYDVAERIRRLEPRARIWAFGSRARGDAGLDADLDVCVVVPEVTAEIERRIREQAWQVAFENEMVIPTVILSEEAFDRGPMSASSLVANIRREGIEIPDAAHESARRLARLGGSEPDLDLPRRRRSDEHEN